MQNLPSKDLPSRDLLSRDLLGRAGIKESVQLSKRSDTEFLFTLSDWDQKHYQWFYSPAFEYNNNKYRLQVNVEQGRFCPRLVPDHVCDLTSQVVDGQIQVRIVFRAQDLAHFCGLKELKLELKNGAVTVRAASSPRVSQVMTFGHTEFVVRVLGQMLWVVPLSGPGFCARVGLVRKLVSDTPVAFNFQSSVQLQLSQQ